MKGAMTGAMRRSRPLLGTFVEIEASGLAEPALARAVNAAFDAIERVHRLMSFHDPESDISRVNRHAAATPVAVDPWTAKVLRRARALFAATDGLFDCAVGYEAIERGLLPPQDSDPVERGTYSAVEILPGNLIRLSARVAIDLGGIAKGFAVDRAVAVLRAHGVQEALVNAGGDMRVTGEAPQPVYIRCPGENRLLVQAGLLRNAAIATSAANATVWKGRSGLSAAPRGAEAAYSVVAPTCLLADALTKVLVQVGTADAFDFDKFGVMAFVTSAAAIVEKAA